jgi:hypothetical protein
VNRLCDRDDCLEPAYLYGRCRLHLTQLTTTEKYEVEVAERRSERFEKQRRASVRYTAAAASFGVSASALLLALGSGVFGPVVVLGLAAGIRFLIEEDD